MDIDFEVCFIFHKFWWFSSVKIKKKKFCLQNYVGLKFLLPKIFYKFCMNT